MIKQKIHLDIFLLRTLVIGCFLCYTAAFILNGSAREPLQTENIEIFNRNTIHVPSKAYKPSPVSSSSKLGKALFVQYNCASCHSVNSHGGCLGPTLLGEGSRRSKDFILCRITAGVKAENRFRQLYNATELMPHPRVSKKTAEAITSYILTLAEPKSGFIMSKHQSDNKKHNNIKIAREQTSPDSVLAGKKLFFEKGCAACHSIAGVGGQFAPTLDDIGSRRNRSNIEQVLNSTQLLSLESADEYGNRGTMMPPLNLSPPEIRKITDFLMTLSSH